MAPDDKPKGQNGATPLPSPANQNGKLPAANVLLDSGTLVETETSRLKPPNPQRRLSNISNESFVDYIPTPPDGGWGWVIVVSSLFCNMIVDGIGYSFGVFLVEFTDYFRQPKSKVSLVGSLLCGVYLFAGPVVSALTNKFGCRAVTVVGSVIAAVSFLLSRFATSVEALMVTYGVMGGFGLGMVYLPSIVSVGYYFEKKRALATGIAVCGSGIGTFVFAPLSEYLLQEYNWKNALMIIAGITLHAAVFGMLVRPLEPPKREHRPRAKNLLDRIKEQAKGNRNRTVSETSNLTYSVRDTNSILERVLEAKLLRERRLQDDESELGSLPSVFFVKQMSRKDSRVHKLSFSDRGDIQGCPESPGFGPKIIVQDDEASSIMPVEGLPTLPENEVLVESGSMEPEMERHRFSAARATSPVASDVMSDTGDDNFGDIMGDGTKSEKSVYYTPPTSPSQPGSPDKDFTGPWRQTSVEYRRSDSQEVGTAADRSKGYANGSVSSDIERHAREVAPLLKATGSKMTIVTIGSDRNLWRLKAPSINFQAAGRTPITSLHSLSVSKKDLARPLYRKDIFYSGSVSHIPEYKSQPDMKSYVTSYTTIPGEVAIISGESKVWSCLPQSVKDTLQEMLDFSLLKDLSFMLICFGNILAFLGFYVPFVYLIDFATNVGVDKSKAAFLISVIGITNTVGRVVTGWLADMRKIDSLVITYLSIFLCGVSTAVFPFCNNYPSLCAVSAIFGLSVAAFISLSSILICDMLGLEKLTNGFGLMTMFRGVAAMAGPPLAGVMYDSTQSYDVSFYLGGALLVAGGLCHVALYLPCLTSKPEPADMVIEAIEELQPEELETGVRPDLLTIEEVQSGV